MERGMQVGWPGVSAVKYKTNAKAKLAEVESTSGPLRRERRTPALHP